MGLLGSILGQVSPGGSGNALIDGVMAMINDPRIGGLQGLVQDFRQCGLGGPADLLGSLRNRLG